MKEENVEWVRDRWNVFHIERVKKLEGNVEENERMIAEKERKIEKRNYRKG